MLCFFSLYKKMKQRKIWWLVFVLVSIATAFGLSLFATINSLQKQNQPAQYYLTFDVSLSTVVYPSTNSTTLQLYQRVPLYSTVQQPFGYTPVTYTSASYEIVAFTPQTNYPVMQLTGSVVFPDKSSLQIQGSVIRDIRISDKGVILKNALISTNIAIVGGTNTYKGAYGQWTSTQTDSNAFVTTIRAQIAVPQWKT